MGYRYFSLRNDGRLPVHITLSWDQAAWMQRNIIRRSRELPATHEFSLSDPPSVRDINVDLNRQEFHIDLRQEASFPNGATISCRCEIPGLTSKTLEFTYDADSNDTFGTRFFGNPFFQSFEQETN
ncbi:hypothetical protein [Bifidobacterium aquikefiri]|uniref:Uncharacterized protein n=1 Tax=Bifidobacterium aquikefiri TaxID=1653207 RepID=A0A261G831_9BIFI|nr:hypothetical protein [Bifidobacterium aquikefiri]OZG67568.1 hypothetical protein BAQU_0660 [Bifidobacterium aquikefiri]